MKLVDKIYINLPLKRRFLVALMQKKRLVSLLAVCETCVTHVSHVSCDNLSDWHFQELAKNIHASQVEDSSPTSLEVTQIDSNSLHSF